ncbi:MAG: pgsA [Gammaproteobacteria bacterium]|jgi:CDP-diacylglycerol--glycerol-3-phosphate 3-phosphatidyltransferase|nr:pgsA [Gammaproteobacteria bacterium]
MTIPNMLTLFRIFLVPMFMLFFYLPFPSLSLLTAAIFAFAAITDWLDGYLARNLSQTTRLGAFLDPVADKLVVVMALVLLVGEHAFSWMAIPAAIIIGREIVVSALREWMAELGQRTSVAVSYLAKIKTVVQMLAIFLLLIGRVHTLTWAKWVAWAGYLGLYAAAILTVWTLLIYLRAAWDEILKAG